jgi:hypothetical protein
MCKKGHQAWNKGLTKETDSRVNAISIGQMGNKSRTGMTNSPEMRDKCSKSMMGKKCGLGNKSRAGQKRSPDEIAKGIITYKKRGYTTSEYNRKKTSERHKGIPRPKHVGEAVAKANKNRIWTADSRRKISEKNSGKTWTDEHKEYMRNLFKGKSMPLEQREKIRRSSWWKHDILVGNGKMAWQDPVKTPIMVAKMRLAKQARPNNLEAKVLEMLNKNCPDEWKYTGNGDLVLNRYCPDFVRNHGHNQIIEMYGDYWHKDENPQDRIDLFDSFGYKTLVIWESEFHKMTEKQFIDRVIEFMNTTDLFYYKPVVESEKM